MKNASKFILLALIVICVLFAFEKQKDAETDSNSITIEFNKEEKVTKEENGFAYNEILIKYKKYEVTDGFLYVYFDMTNNTEENVQFNYSFDVIGWQDGIELETNYFFDCEEEQNAQKEIKPGVTLTVAEVFKLRNESSDATIEFRPWASYKETTLFEFNIEIK